MPAVQRQQYLSQAQTIVSTNQLRFSGFVPAFGPNGLRNVIDSMDVIVELSAVTVADAVVEGEDVWRALSLVTLRQVDGVERLQGLKGDALRQYCYFAMGADRVPEYADIPIAAGTAVSWSFPIPLEQRYYRRPKAFSLPAELFRELIIGGPDTGTDGLGAGTPTVSALAGTIRVIAHCHEEDSIEQKLVDQVSVHSFPALTGMTLKAPGKLHGLLLYSRAEVGGASLSSSFTSIQIPGLLPDALTHKLDLIPGYLQERGAAPNDANAADGSNVHNDPVASLRAVPVIWPNEDTSSFDGASIDEVIVKTSMSQSDMLAIVRSVLPESEQLKGWVERAHGIGRGEWRAKTISKGQNARKNLAGSPWIEKSAPLRRRGLMR